MITFTFSPIFRLGHLIFRDYVYSRRFCDLIWFAVQKKYVELRILVRKNAESMNI